MPSIHSLMMLIAGAALAVAGPPAAGTMSSPESGQPHELLIPGGTFLMGSEAETETQPVHSVRLDAFYLDVHEVTNAQYVAFCQATGRVLPEFWGSRRFRSGLDFPDHPVVGVSWYDATAYAEWAGKRLPTEAEWEYAARGGLVGKAFPTGDVLEPTHSNHASTTPRKVGRFPANGFGLHDMAGNVWEWVADAYDATYYARSPELNPPGPADRRLRVIRGGGWRSGPTCNRVYYRNALPPGWVDMAVGFRCARDAD